jgi:hypothetical protein
MKKNPCGEQYDLKRHSISTSLTKNDKKDLRVHVADRPDNASPPKKKAAVFSAARAQPLEPESTQPKRLSKERIEATASDTVLNAFSILSEVIEDFKNADRFFKYKAGVLSSWLLLSAFSFVVACPQNPHSNVLEASLLLAGDASRPIYLLQNDSSTDWNQVEVLVNGGAFKSTLSKIPSNGGTFTLSGAVLYDDSGNRAPSSLVVSDVEVRARSPKGAVVLLRDSQLTAPRK